MNSNTTRLAALLLLLAGGGFAAWFFSGGAGQADVRGGASRPAMTRTSDSAKNGAALVGGAPASLATEDSASSARSVLVAEAESDASAAALDLVPWTGRVVWAPGTPQDERGEVIVFRTLGERAPFWDPEAESEEADEVARATVAADGTFTIDAPRDGTRWIDLRARYGYLERALALPDGALTEVELTPKLGAYLRGTTRVPDGIDVAQLSGSTFELSRSGGGMDFRAMMDPNARRLEGQVDERGDFALGGVPAGTYKLRLASLATAPLEREEVGFIAGTTTELNLTLEAGARLAGRVFDQDEAPLADVRVRARAKSEADDRIFGPGSRRRRGASTRTGPDGSFELAGVPGGTIELEVDGVPLLRNIEQEVEVADGSSKEGIQLQGQRGQRLTGRVVWPDGAPAEGVLVTPRLDESALEGQGRANWRESQRVRRIQATTDADGSFELTGLDPEIALLLAATYDESQQESPAIENSREADPAHPLPADLPFVARAESESLLPGDGPVELQLRVAPALIGFVRAPDGSPVERFDLTAIPAGGNRFMARMGGDSSIELSVDDPRGSFALVGLLDGDWKLSAEADGYAIPEKALEIAWPDALDGEPPVLTLEPEARVVARVFDPSGRLVPGAEVRDVSTGWREQMSGEGRDISERTDALGGVTIEHLPAGRYLFSASAAGFAPSEPLELELKAGDVEANVELRLARGGRIEGSVLSTGGAIEDRTVMLMGSGSDATDSGLMARTDAKGRFVLEAVPAGEWNLILPPSDGFGGGGPSMAGMETATVQVVDGETTYIELGTPPAEPVEVRGRVTSGGEPVSGEVVFIKSGSNVLDGLAMTTADEDGRYSLTLDEPGTYLATANGPDGLTVRETAKIAGDTVLDLTIPSGAITGIVRENGEPKGNVDVRLHEDGPLSTGAMLGAEFSSFDTDSDGTFRIGGLAPGTYRVTVGGSSMFREASTSRVVRGGIEVREDETTSGIEFDLETPGIIAATVEDSAGKVVGRGSIFVRDENGFVVNPVANSSRSSDGRFEVKGIAPGTYTVSFRGSENASSESRPVRVESEKTTEVELVAPVGSKLIVSVVDGDGESLDVAIEVIDADGKMFQGMVSGEFGFGPPEGGWAPGEETYGPLPAGTYTVRAVHADGRESSRKVKLGSRPERKLTVRLR